MSDPRLSQALDRIGVSPTMAITARAAELRAEGVDIIGLSAGEPDFPTPGHVVDAAVAAMRGGQTRYTAVDGTPDLKAAIAAKFARDNHLEFTPDQISVNCGGKHSLFNALVATLDAGNEAIVPAPYWVSYPDMVRFTGATPVIVETDAADGYKLTPRQLADAITPATRWLILNSPSNPTGAVYSADELSALGEVLGKHPQVLVLSDDIYEHIRYSSLPYATLGCMCPDLAERILTVNGVSKAYSMTGWRLGFAAGPSWLIQAMRTLQSQSTSNPSSISQAASIAALTGPQDFLRDRRKVFKARRDSGVAMLNDTPGLACQPPGGAFYLFVDASGLIGRSTPDGEVLADDLAITAYLLETAGVAVVPGSAFGSSPAFRISYALEDSALSRALGRIQSACVALR